MKIKNININHFGNLENKDISLQDGINLIYGKNESGKSTLLNYIRTIFYGISKKKNGKEISDYDRYNPWMKDDFSGRLTYELDNGKKFEIFRDFKSKNPKIYNENLEEISKEFNIDKKDGVQFFYDQTNVDELTFLSTVVSMQQEVKLDKENQNILLQKIANLAGTGDDSTSFQKVLDKLNKKQVDEIGTDRTQEKPINIVKKKMKQISLEINDIELAKNEKDSIQENKNKISNKINKLELKNYICMQLNELMIDKNVEDEKIKLKTNIKNENKEKIEKLLLEKNQLIQNKEKILKIENNEINKEKINQNEQNIKKEKNNKLKNNYKKYIILESIIILFSIILEIINKIFLKQESLDYFIYGLLVVGIISVLGTIINSKIKNKKLKREYDLQKQLEKQNLALEEEKNKNELIKVEQQIENIENQVKNYKEEIEKQEKEIYVLQENSDQKIDETIEKIKLKNPSINIDDLLENIDLKNIKNTLYDVQEELNQEKLALNTLENEEKNIISKLENMIALEEEYNQLEVELKDLEENTKYISLTKDYLNKAYEKMKNSVTPRFTENLSKNISDISNKKYTKVSIHDEEGIIVENQYGEYIPANQLSIGTIDQLYLSLRLSMIDDLSSENMPIILDETFAYYDDERLNNILQFLIKRVQKNQIILFTCTKREQEMLNRMGFPYNLVELS